MCLREQNTKQPATHDDAPPETRTDKSARARGLRFVLFIAAAANELEPLVGADQGDVVDAGGEEKILEETSDKIKKR